MGTLAKALIKPQSVTIAGVEVTVTPLSISELFDCIAEAGRGLDLEGKTPEQFAEDAISGGTMPVKTFGFLLRKACTGIDADDIGALLADKTYEHALKLIAAALGEDPDSMTVKTVKPTKGTAKKKRSR